VPWIGKNQHTVAHIEHCGTHSTLCYTKKCTPSLSRGCRSRSLAPSTNAAKHSLTMNFMFPVPDASVPAVDICSERSAAGITFSAKDTLANAKCAVSYCRFIQTLPWQQSGSDLSSGTIVRRTYSLFRPRHEMLRSCSTERVRSAMSKPQPAGSMRSSPMFCAAQWAYHYCACTIQRQPVFILIILNLTFSMQWSLVPVDHVLRTDRYPHVHWHLGAKLISSFVISNPVFFCKKLISNYLCCSMAQNLPWHHSLGVSAIQSLPLQLVCKCFQQLYTELWFAKMKVCHSMCGSHKDSDIIFGPY